MILQYKRNYLILSDYFFSVHRRVVWPERSFCVANKNVLLKAANELFTAHLAVLAESGDICIYMVGLWKSTHNSTSSHP